ncbi:MAG: hypothetical protein ACK40G_18295 [Cytophagaceae bacterium]
MTTLLFLTGLSLGLILIYIFVLRPYQLHWGATAEEVKMALPGDNIVKSPDFKATRGITIDASPQNIWRWIIQIGSKRAGWYSIDWIDNAGIKSTDKIISQFQKIEIGQFIPFTPDQKNGMWVKDFKENNFILWTDNDGKATWLWQLIPIDNGKTRLLTRLNTKYKWSGIWIIYYILFDIGDIIMMRKTMKGIKQRAEKMQK